MADTKGRQSVKIVDPTTGANEAGVTAAGELKVSPTTALPAGTNNIGDVDVLTTPGTFAEDAASAGGETGRLVLGVRNDAAASKTSADGDFSAFATDAAGRIGIADLGGTVSVDDNGGSLTVDGTVAVSGTVDTELPAAAALADAAANPTVPTVGVANLGFNGTTWDRIRTANTGRVQVDVVTGGGTETPTNPVVSHQTSASVAAGASQALTTAEAAGKKLRKVVVWSTVPFKATVHTVDNAVESAVKAAGGGPALMPFTLDTPHRNYITLGTTAGLDAFRVNVTNLDQTSAADVYATFFYED